MRTAHCCAAATAALLLGVATPASATMHEPAPSEAPLEVQWPPASTHGAFRPLPDQFAQPATLPLCGSEVTIGPGDVNTTEYRALVTAAGDTVVEYRGTITADITRASDGASLDELSMDGRSFETYHADGRTATFDYHGSALVIALDPLELEVFEEAGLPQASFFLSGRIVETVTLESAPGPDQEYPPVVSAEITENSTEYVFDLCELLDQAAAGQQPPTNTAPASP